MTALYRVEDSNHVGPYQTPYVSESQSRMGLAHGYDPFGHPAPPSSGYWMFPGDKCAFRSMQDLFRWFGGYLPSLIAAGFKVVKVNGRVTFDDGHQVVYRPI